MAGSVMPVTVRCYLELLACFGLCWVGVMAGRPDEMEVFLKVPCSPETVLCLGLITRLRLETQIRVKRPGWLLTVACRGLGHTFAEVSRLAVQSLGLRDSDTAGLPVHLDSRHLFSPTVWQAQGPTCK